MQVLVKIFKYSFLIIGIIISIYSISSYNEESEIIESGGQTIGKFLGYDISTDVSTGAKIYNGVFEYYVDSIKYLTESKLGNSKDYKKGEDYVIFYDRDNPKKTVINSMSERIYINLLRGFLSFVFVGLILSFTKSEKIIQLFKNN